MYRTGRACTQAGQKQVKQDRLREEILARGVHVNQPLLTEKRPKFAVVVSRRVCACALVLEM